MESEQNGIIDLDGETSKGGKLGKISIGDEWGFSENIVGVSQTTKGQWGGKDMAISSMEGVATLKLG